MYIYMYVYVYVRIYIIITEGLFEVTIESWPEWDLNTKPLQFHLFV